MPETTIPLTEDVRDRIRKIKGHDRTYAELLTEWADNREEGRQ